MRPIRSVALISPFYYPEEGGGIGTYVRTLAEELVRRGVTVHVLTGTRQTAQVETISGVQVHRITPLFLPLVERLVPGLSWSIKLAYMLNKIRQAEGLDLVEFPNWEGPGWFYVHWPWHLPVVTRLHTPFFETLRIDSSSKPISLGERFTCWLERSAVLASDYVTASTRFHRAMMTDAYSVPESDVAIVPLGISLPDLPSTTIDDQPTETRLLYVSRLEHRKGTLTFLRSLPRILLEAPSCRVTIVGKDRPQAPGNRPFEEYFRETYPQLCPQVQFCGYLADKELAAEYEACDVFVVPSVYESFGLIFVEAMAFGKPVVGCHAGGVPEVIDDGVTGILVPPNDSDALADSVLRLLRDPALRRRMGRHGRARVESFLSASVMADNTLAVYAAAITLRASRELPKPKRVPS